MNWRSLNERLATCTTAAMATMACVWVFLIWSILPLVWPETRDMVFYVSGGVIQLIALPLIMVGQAYLSRASDALAKEQHDAVLEILADVREEHAARHTELLQRHDDLAQSLAVNEGDVA